ncbi:MAG: CPBP family intramembrane metalloprotease [Rhizobiaceae bacterium]|nr:CPBP family intramembrane metalloprotease [Rhizobiaceae bacterium]
MKSPAFEVYRSSQTRPVTIWRVLLGLLIIGVCWLATSVLAGLPALLGADTDVATYFASRLGTLITLASFAGIWIGVWIASRLIHKEPLADVLGATGRLNYRDFAKGFAAVAITSLLSEILIYGLEPRFERTDLPFATWLIFAIPVLAFCFVQTSAEELLFRGYLPRHLANRFRSPWVWALLPSVAFICLHLSPGMQASQILLVTVSIGILTALMMFTVWLTGNLGAAFGIHMGNNLFSFALVAHQEEFSGLALFRGVPVNEPGMSGWFAFSLVAIGVVCVSLTALLLLHARSPLRISNGS